MNVAHDCVHISSSGPRTPLSLVGLSCGCQGKRCSRQQHRTMMFSGAVRVPTHKTLHRASARRHGLSFTYSLRTGATRLVKAPTLERAPRTLQHPCFAAAIQADKEAVQIPPFPDSISTTDKEQHQLSQVLMCTSKTLSAEVSMSQPTAASQLTACC